VILFREIVCECVENAMFPLPAGELWKAMGCTNSGSL
jgi:hypothetical protein